jgi:hypothetical protein
VSREINYRNPWGSVPSPKAKDVPQSLWITERLAVPWSGLGAVAAGLDQGIWRSPVFDLRPDLRSANSAKKEGIPVWNPSARLYVQIFNLNFTAATTEDLRLNFAERANTTYGHVYSAAPNRAVGVPTPPSSGFPNQAANQAVVTVTARVDITSEIMMSTLQPDSAVLTFVPLGEGYPVRYWSIDLFFSKLFVAGPPLNLQAAMY